MIQDFLQDRGFTLEKLDNIIQDARRWLDTRGVEVSAISTSQEGRKDKMRTVVHIHVDTGRQKPAELQAQLRREIGRQAMGVVVLRLEC